MFEALATDADLLGAVREQRTIADQAEARILELACAWADAHPATDLEPSPPT